MVPPPGGLPTETIGSRFSRHGITWLVMERATLGRMQNPIRGFLHGGAAFAALSGTVYLVLQTWGNTSALIGSLVFGGALLVMYTVSSLYHSVPWNTEWKRRLQRIDHSMIYLVVAGTFTPIAIAGLDGAQTCGVWVWCGQSPWSASPSN